MQPQQKMHVDFSEKIIIMCDLVWKKHVSKCNCMLTEMKSLADVT